MDKEQMVRLNSIEYAMRALGDEIYTVDQLLHTAYMIYNFMTDPNLHEV